MTLGTSLHLLHAHHHQVVPKSESVQTQHCESAWFSLTDCCCLVPTQVSAKPMHREAAFIPCCYISQMLRPFTPVLNTSGVPVISLKKVRS